LQGPATAPQPRRADGVTRRLVYSIALIPIVPAASIATLSTLEAAFPFSNLGDLRYFQLLFSTLVVITAIAIWTKTVVWTMGRRWLTALVSLIPFVQVAVNLPLWTAPRQGCTFLDFSEEALRTGQHQLGVGVWVWLIIWVWWGWEKLDMAQKAERMVAKFRVPTTAKRLVACIAMFPFLVGVWLISYEAAELVLPSFPGGGDHPFTGALALAVWSAIASALWVMIWRSAVVWSPKARWHTIISWGVLVGLPLGVSSIAAYRSTNAAPLWLTLIIIGWGAWMAWTIRIWPMKPEAVSVDPLGPRCLRCGYSLRGLRATRCPECGDEPTLDELWADNSVGSS